MPRLTPTQLQELAQIIKRYADRFLITVFGRNVISQADLQSLIDANLIPDTTDPQVLEHSYVLGKLKAILTAPEYNAISFEKMKEVAMKLQGPAGARGPSWTRLEPQTEIERVRIAGAQASAARGVQNIADNIKQGLFRDLEVALGKTVTEAIIKDEIKDTVATAIRTRRTVSQLSYDIPRRLKTYSRDWLRVASTEMHSARMNGTADAILQEEGQYAGFPDTPEEKRVIVRPTTGACPECRRDYLDTSGNPIIWKLSELLANGTNIGIPKAQRGPVVPPHHPWPLLLEGTEVLTDEGWIPLVDVGIGAKVLGVDLASGNSGWTDVTNVYRRKYTGDLDHFHNTRLDLIAAPDHQHPVCFSSDGFWKFVSGEDLPAHNWSFLVTNCEQNWLQRGEQIVGSVFDNDVFYKVSVDSIKWDKIPAVDTAVGCIELEKYHTFFMRRNGKVVLTGNCLCEMDYIPPGFGFDASGRLTLLDPSKLYGSIS